MELGGRVRHIIGAQAMQTAREPIQDRALMDVVPLEEDMPDLAGPDNRLCLPGGALRSRAILFCHGLRRCRFHAAGPFLLYTAAASPLASSTPEQVASGR